MKFLQSVLSAIFFVSSIDAFIEDEILYDINWQNELFTVWKSSFSRRKEKISLFQPTDFENGFKLKSKRNENYFCSLPTVENHAQVCSSKSNVSHRRSNFSFFRQSLKRFFSPKSKLYSTIFIRNVSAPIEWDSRRLWSHDVRFLSDFIKRRIEKRCNDHSTSFYDRIFCVKFLSKNFCRNVRSNKSFAQLFRTLKTKIAKAEMTFRLC